MTEQISLPYRFTPREYQYPFLRYFDETPNRQRAFLLAHRRTRQGFAGME